MKKIFLTCLAAVFFAAAYAQAPEEFIIKAETAGKILAKKQAEQIRAKKRYEYTAKKINQIKEEKAKGGIKGTLSSMKLSYYLKTGNRAGYRNYILGNEIRELRDERFTYIMIIIDEYTKTLRECFKSKCRQADELFAKREKWMAVLNEYKDMLQIDFDFKDMLGNLKTGAKEDLKKYLEGKLVQADERLYLLKEEKIILKEAAAAGIKVVEQTGIINNIEIKELEQIRKKIEGMIKGLK